MAGIQLWASLVPRSKIDRVRVPRFFSSITIILASLYPIIAAGREQTNR